MRTREVEKAMRGQIRQFSANVGLGVIRPEDGRGDVRFLRSSVISRYRPKRNESVEFELIYGPKGPEAVDIRPI